MNPPSEETMVFNILPSKTADNDNYRPLGSTNRKWPPTHCFQQRLIIIPAVSKTPDGHSGLWTFGVWTFGVWTFGVEGWGLRTFGVEDIRGYG